jgi:hypothetical protein
MSTLKRISRVKLADKFCGVDAQIKALEEERKALKSEFIRRGYKLIIGMKGTVHKTECERSDFDIKKFREVHPKLAKKFTNVKDITQIRVKHLQIPAKEIAHNINIIV